LETVAFKKSIVFSTNSTLNNSKIYNIPIGIENLHYFKNGITSNFSNAIEIPKKNVLLSSNFRTHTNKNIRVNIKNLCENSRHGFMGEDLTQNESNNLLLNSYFCISPPGNGKDCHRTWEAIYTKCIPIVLKNTLSNDLYEGLPIFVVDNYQDVLLLTDAELLKLYYEIMAKSSTEKAYFNYWIHKIEYLRKEL
jgi:hypothetical protein